MICGKHGEIQGVGVEEQTMPASHSAGDAEGLPVRKRRKAVPEPLLTYPQHLLLLLAFMKIEQKK